MTRKVLEISCRYVLWAVNAIAVYVVLVKYNVCLSNIGMASLLQVIVTGDQNITIIAIQQADPRTRFPLKVAPLQENGPWVRWSTGCQAQFQQNGFTNQSKRHTFCLQQNYASDAWYTRAFIAPQLLFCIWCLHFSFDHAKWPVSLELNEDSMTLHLLPLQNSSKGQLMSGIMEASVSRLDSAPFDDQM